MESTTEEIGLKPRCGYWYCDTCEENTIQRVTNGIPQCTKCKKGIIKTGIIVGIRNEKGKTTIYKNGNKVKEQIKTFKPIPNYDLLFLL